MTITPDTFTVIGTGIALAALNIGLFAWLRSDVQELRREAHQHGQQIGSLRERMAKLDGLLEDLRQEVARHSNQIGSLREQMASLREGMTKLEGLVEGLREAIAERRTA